MVLLPSVPAVVCYFLLRTAAVVAGYACVHACSTRAYTSLFKRLVQCVHEGDLKQSDPFIATTARVPATVILLCTTYFSRFSPLSHLRFDLLVAVVDDLGQAEVSQLDDLLAVHEEHVVGLYVAVQHLLLLVQVMHAQAELPITAAASFARFLIIPGAAKKCLHIRGGEGR